MWLNNPRDPSDMVENIAFTCNAMRQEQLDAIVDRAIADLQNVDPFNPSLSINVPDDCTDYEMAYIEEQVRRRWQNM